MVFFLFLSVGFISLLNLPVVSDSRQTDCKGYSFPFGASTSAHTMASEQSELWRQLSQMSLNHEEIGKLDGLLRDLRERIKAQLPDKKIVQAKKSVVETVTKVKIYEYLKSNFPSLVEPRFVGSSYEGGSIGNSNEYDILLVFDGKKMRKEQDDTKYWLLYEQSDGDQDLKVSSERKVQELIGALERGKKNIPELASAVIKQGSGHVFIEVKEGEMSVKQKLIPCFRHEEGGLFVPSFAKEGKEKWVISYPELEKRALKREGCCKDVLRLLKIMRSKESSLKALTSYHLKTVLLFVLQNPSLSWGADDLADRWLGVLNVLIVMVERKYIPYSDINIFPSLEDAARTNIVNLLQRIRKKELALAERCYGKAKGADHEEGHHELTSLLRRYYAAKVPASREMARGQKELMEQIIATIKQQLQQENYINEIRYTGSAYEGVNLKQSSDYDLMVVMDGTNKVTIFKAVPAFAMLQTVDPTFREKFCVNDGLIKPAKVMSHFMGLLTKIIGQIKREPAYVNSDLTIVPRLHGPAIEIEVKRNEDQIFVDITPAFKLSEGVRYIAKTLKEGQVPREALGGNQLDMFWRQSFSLEEVELLKRADNDGGCRKMVLRIMKALRKDESALKKLSSYHMKTLLMQALRRQDIDWSETKLAERFLEFLGNLAESFQNRFLGHYFVDGFNLYQGIGDQTFDNMRNRVMRILNSPIEQKKIFAVNNNA